MINETRNRTHFANRPKTFPYTALDPTCLFCKIQKSKCYKDKEQSQILRLKFNRENFFTWSLTLSLANPIAFGAAGGMSLTLLTCRKWMKEQKIIKKKKKKKVENELKTENKKKVKKCPGALDFGSKELCEEFRLSVYLEDHFYW